MGEGMDGGCMPLPTHPQRYCDPTSLVLIQCMCHLLCHFSLDFQFRPTGASCSTKANRYVDDLIKTSLNRFSQLENDQIEQMFEADAKKAPFAESLRPFHAILEAVSFADDKKREKVGWMKARLI